MKKHLLTLILSCLAIASVQADLIYYEPFNYADGATTNVSAGVWRTHSTSGANDSFVKNHRLEVSGNTSTNAPRQSDVNRPFCLSSCTYTSSLQVVYASFTINCTNLPTTFSNYIAHFLQGTSLQQAKIWSLIGGLPGTWRLGISGSANAVNKIYPVDLAPNVDYQVVVGFNPTLGTVDTLDSDAARLWVNPISPSDPSIESNDGTAGAIMQAFAFRQAAGTTSFFAAITNLATATTYDEASTNVWTTNAVAPIVVASPASGTNFSGDSANLSAVAAGQGLGSLTYTWQKNGNSVANPNGNSNVFSIASAAVGDSGNYRMIVTTPFGLSATSTVAFLWVTNAPIPPTITPTTNSTVVGFYHQSATLSVSASGPPTISYQWYYNNGPLGINTQDDGNGHLTITDIFTNNGTAGAYYAVASNPYGSKTSGVFTVTASAPPTVSVAFLRTLVDPNTYLVTNSNQRWTAIGTVTTYTNLTTVDTSSYYLQDGTGGLNIFVTHGGGSDLANGNRFWAPQQGDVVMFTGFLASFNSNLELSADTNDISTSFTVLSNSLASLPAPKVIPFSITNNLEFCETNLEGTIVVLTNVFFGTNAGVTLSTTANTTITVTNAAGETFQVFFPFEDLDIAGRTLPAFANTLAGVFTQNLANTGTPRNSSYNVTLTRFSDIVTNPIALYATKSGANTVLSWSAAPYTYSYTLRSASSVLGPYTPVATGLRFTDFNGTYTDTSAGSQKFYKLTVP
jgi:hypothetical protein